MNSFVSSPYHCIWNICWFFSLFERLAAHSRLPRLITSRSMPILSRRCMTGSHTTGRAGSTATWATGWRATAAWHTSSRGTSYRIVSSIRAVTGYLRRLFCTTSSTWCWWTFPPGTWGVSGVWRGVTAVRSLVCWRRLVSWLCPGVWGVTGQFLGLGTLWTRMWPVVSTRSGLVAIRRIGLFARGRETGGFGGGCGGGLGISWLASVRVAGGLSGGFGGGSSSVPAFLHCGLGSVLVGDYDGGGSLP